MPSGAHRFALTVAVGFPPLYIPAPLCNLISFMPAPFFFKIKIQSRVVIILYVVNNARYSFIHDRGSAPAGQATIGHNVLFAQQSHGL